MCRKRWVARPDMNNRTTLDPQQAMEYGLVREIRSELYPMDADLSVIGEASEQQPAAFPAPGVPGAAFPPTRAQHFAPPRIERTSGSAAMSSGIPGARRAERHA
jgi:hypothetical protein